MKKVFLVLNLILFSLTYSQFKAIIISNEGKEYSGFVSETDYYDIEHREPEDMYKVFLYDGPKKRKSEFKKFDHSEIKNFYLYNKKDQKIEFVFVKSTTEKFNSMKSVYRSYHKPKEKAEDLSYGNAWIPMIMVKQGKELDLICDFLWIDFKVSKTDNTFITDFFNRYYVKEKNSDIPKILGSIGKHQYAEHMIFGGNDEFVEQNAIEIFSGYCPKMITDINSKNFIFGNKILKVFDYYLQNCN